MRSRSSSSVVMFGGPGGRRAGLKVLIPGYPQWSWHQKERGLALFGSFLAAAAVGVFVWGTKAGVAMLLFAFGTHVISVADAVRQGSFPGFGRWVPITSAASGLGLGGYAPALVAALVFAWPGYREDATGEGYLIDRWTYRQREPDPGEWVWLRGPGPRLARVVAGPGQEVDLSQSGLRVGGKGQSLRLDDELRRSRELLFRIPSGHLLILPVPGQGAASEPPHWQIVPTSRVTGRAWARSYPIWRRGALG